MPSVLRLLIAPPNHFGFRPDRFGVKITGGLRGGRPYNLAGFKRSSNSRHSFLERLQQEEQDNRHKQRQAPSMAKNVECSH